MTVEISGMVRTYKDEDGHVIQRWTLTYALTLNRLEEILRRAREAGADDHAWVDITRSGVEIQWREKT